MDFLAPGNDAHRKNATDALRQKLDWIANRAVSSTSATDPKPRMKFLDMPEYLSHPYSPPEQEATGTLRVSPHTQLTATPVPPTCNSNRNTFSSVHGSVVVLNNPDATNSKTTGPAVRDASYMETSWREHEAEDKSRGIGLLQARKTTTS